MIVVASFQVSLQYSKMHIDKEKATAFMQLIDAGKKDNNIFETQLALYMYQEGYTDSNNTSKYFSSTNIRKAFLSASTKVESNNKLVVRQFFAALSLLPLLALGVYLYINQVIQYYGYQSFIKITKKANNEYNNYMLLKNKSQYYSLSFLGMTIILSVLSNFIYQFFIS